jgi:hypothetical protein
VSKTKSQTETRQVPAAALRFDANLEFIADVPRDDPMRIPVRILARTGEAIAHPWWGKIVHDLSGMKLRKPRIQLDWCHWEWESVGYADGFDVSSGDLIVTGELISTHEGDEASRIIAKGQAGIPYEASIDFNGPGLRLEELGEETSEIVNGREVQGPAIIVREWPLRSVAICPYGADPDTNSEFSERGDGLVSVPVFTKEEVMGKKLSKLLNNTINKLSAKPKGKSRRTIVAELAAAGGISVREMTDLLRGQGQTVSKATASSRLTAWAKALSLPIAPLKAALLEDQNDKDQEDDPNDEEEMEGEDDADKEQDGEDDADKEQDGEDDSEPDPNDPNEGEENDGLPDDEEMDDEEESDKQQSAISKERKELKRFIKAFGATYGAKWFAAGKSFTQALALHADRMKKLAEQKDLEAKKLRRKLASLDTGEEEALPYNDGGDRGHAKQQKLGEYERKIGSNLARFAAGVKLPK